MHLKHVWSHKPQPGTTTCIVPASLARRLKAYSKYAWRNLAHDIEDVSRNLPKFGLAMMSKNDQVKLTTKEKNKAAVKWHSELEIDIISSMIKESVKFNAGAQTAEQENKMTQQCAEFGRIHDDTR